ncbi:Coatomer subunit zeta (CopZ) [Blattamonas nauphoetae]|uniref:Coatomer subunit zeta n=1 Tax=Blattamonas nauphoetae TaxID=2049346 RepID=A0ABQ9YM46_9EUKA|nr:Coatomer subunit zeta (CopZ) [Blattamonas nauphoetae]
MSEIRTIEGIYLFDSSGKTIYSNYLEGFDKKVTSIVAFENALISRCKNDNKNETSGMFTLGPYIVGYKTQADVTYTLIAHDTENEEIVWDTLIHLVDAVLRTFKNSVSSANLLAHYDLLLLCVDAIIDNGIIFDDDMYSINKRISATSEGMTQPSQSKASDLSSGPGVSSSVMNAAKGFMSKFFG